ncbi:hypothetical protein TNCV_3449461 [Trichonephila clavipes]|nr:hypothetical protein TNCV_3449461 [Trichonephila clavipes]
MMDGKVCSWPAHSFSQNSRLFYAKPNCMTDLEAMKTREIVMENVELNISSLHAWIKCFECLMHISYSFGYNYEAKKNVHAPDHENYPLWVGLHLLLVFDALRYPSYAAAPYF